MDPRFHCSQGPPEETSETDRVGRSVSGLNLAAKLGEFFSEVGVIHHQVDGRAVFRPGDPRLAQGAGHLGLQRAARHRPMAWMPWRRAESLLRDAVVSHAATVGAAPHLGAMSKVRGRPD